MGQLEHYCIGKIDLNAENRWTILNGKKFRIEKPTVICCGGNKTLNAKGAHYMCSLAQNLIGVKGRIDPHEIASIDDIDFVGIGYGANKQIGDDLSPSNIGYLVEEEIAELAKSLFAPLYLDGNQIRPQEQIVKNFSLITFFSHCYGSKEVNDITYQAYKDMLIAGVEKQIAEEAFSQVFVVSYAPWQSTICPSLQVIPEKDSVLLGGPTRASVTTDFLRNRHIYPGKGTVAYKENANTVTVFVSDMTNHSEDEHGIAVVRRNKQWQFLDADVAYGNEVSMAMAVGLSESIKAGILNQRNVEFTPKPTVDDILRKVQSILGKTQNHELERAIEQIKNPAADELGDFVREV